MRSSILDSFVFLSLMAWGQALVPYREIENDSSIRNSVAEISQDTLSPLISYTCMRFSADLPPCDFGRAGDFDPSTFRSDQRHRRSMKNPGDQRRVVVYSIQGCLPSRLPFNVPVCKPEDFAGSHVEEHKLYPFEIKGLSKATLVFPKHDLNKRVHKMKRLRRHYEASLQNGKTQAESTNHADLSSLRTSPKISNLILPYEKDDLEAQETEVSDPKSLNDLVRPELQTPTNEQVQKDPKKRRKKSQKIVHNTKKFLATKDRSTLDSRTFERAPPSWRQRSPKELGIAGEFPHEHENSLETRRRRAIPFDPSRKFFRTGTNPFSRRKSREIKVEAQFPYWKAIPYDPQKLVTARSRTQHSRKLREARPLGNENLHEGEFDGKPDRNKMPYDQWKRSMFKADNASKDRAKTKLKSKAKFDGSK